MTKPFVHLHTHSAYSLRDGVSTPEELVKRAATFKMPALALTDHDALYGAIPFVEAAQEHSIKPILGAELTLENGHHLTLLAADETGWHNLCVLVTQARLNAPKGKAALPTSELPKHSEGLMALSGCRQGAITSQLLQRNRDTALAAAKSYVDLFGKDRFFIELQNQRLAESKRLVASLVDLAKQIGVGYVATNNVHYATHDHYAVHDLLTSIRHNSVLGDNQHQLRANGHYYLKSGQQMAALFAEYPQAISNTLRIAERCTYTPRYGLQELPAFPTPADLSASAYLRHLCLEAVPKRYGGETPEPVRRQLDRELDVIERKGLTNYFLIVWDIVHFARERGIRCQGRGSAANSIVAYLLYITPVDPIKYDLVFERFLSEERTSAADIDIDFASDRREEVIQYIYDRWGRDHAAMACTFVTFRRRSSLRSAGKALGLSDETMSLVIDEGDFFDSSITRSKELPPKTARKLLYLSNHLKGLPNYTGIHNGAFVLSGPPLSTWLPVEPATMEGRTVTQADKYALEDSGKLKLDILGLRTLQAISLTLQEIECTTGQCIDFDTLNFDDPAVYRMISSGDTIGVFQVDSRAQQHLVQVLEPKEFRHLHIGNSLIRPGPIQFATKEFMERWLGRKPVTYDHASLEPVLKETLGIIIWQEQVAQVAEALAGFTRGQGEQLRRALGKRDAEAAIEAFHETFVSGCMRKAVSREIAEIVFNKLRAFASYSFPKSHAAAFAAITYQCAWLKCYYPVQFITSILNCMPMGFWNSAIVVGDAQRHDIPVLPVDVNLSRDRWTCDGTSIRVGVSQVKGFEEERAKEVVSARGAMPFSSLADFHYRTQFPKKLTKNLIHAGGFDWTGIARRQMIWTINDLSPTPEVVPIDIPQEEIQLPPQSSAEAQQNEYRFTGVHLHGHPMEQYRAYRNKYRLLDSKAAKAAPNGKIVDVIGLIAVHQAPPSAKGFHFLTLEDEHGLLDVIVNPRVYKAFRQIIHQEPILIIRGKVQQEGKVTSMIAQEIGYAQRGG